MTLKHSISKKWQRVTDSRYTIAFVVISIIQAITLITLQIRILSRNTDIFLSILDQDECTLDSQNIFACLMFESIMFVVFNLYLLYFCLNAIFHQNFVQLYTIIVINGIEVILGIIQMIGVKINVTKIESDCPNLQIDYTIKSYELPHIIALAIIAITMGALFFGKLSQQLDWDIYKKIGGDIEVRKRYKIILIFEMLLKIDLFFVILYGSITAPLVFYDFIAFYDQYDTGFKVFVFVCLSILILVFFFQALAYKSIRKEWKVGMIIFIIFWIFALLDFCYLTYDFGIVMIQIGIYSWAILLCLLIICAILTFIYAIIVTRNFNKGLKKYLNKKKKTEQKESNILPDNNDDVKDIEDGSGGNNNNNNNTKKLFTIDD
ncbi:hypothetical protein C1646_743761 [Rhizophagus diaphanus]|nr:hypothetical protein C1646_743761 [Rhizophagus diaphanus] [Rhizophagus sp. MUCL 43196]